MQLLAERNRVGLYRDEMNVGSIVAVASTHVGSPWRGLNPFDDRELFNNLGSSWELIHALHRKEMVSSLLNFRKDTEDIVELQCAGLDSY